MPLDLENRHIPTIGSSHDVNVAASALAGLLLSCSISARNRSLLRQADQSDPARINHLTKRHALRALAKPVDRQLNTAFAALFED